MKKIFSLFVITVSLLFAAAAFAAPPGDPGKPGGQPGQPGGQPGQGQPAQPGQGQFRDRVYIEEMEFKRGDRLEVDFELPPMKRISWNSGERISVRDAQGKKFRVNIVKRDKDDVKLRIEGLKPGQNYTLSITGLTCDGKKYDFRENFTAQNGWKVERHH